MPRNIVITLFFLSIIAFDAVAELEPIRLILKWDHQYQFSGYYAAQWQGFYAEEGLDVTFIARPQKDGTFLTLKDEINEGRADFAVGGPTILQDIEAGNEFVLISSIYQRSPFSFVVLKESPIKNLSDLHSACIESSRDFGDLELKVLMQKEGLLIDNVKWKDFTFALGGIASKECDVVIDYSLSAKWASKEKGLEIRELKAEQFGVNFYGDLLYTSKKLVESNPLLVEKFKRASLKGWNYALENPSEISKEIGEKFEKVFNYNDNYAYNMMSYESIKKLMNYPLVEVGHSNIDRWKKIQEYLYSIGEVKTEKIPNWFLFDFIEYENLENKRKFYYSVFIMMIFIICYLVFFVIKKRKDKKLNNEKELLIENQDLLYAVLDLLPMSIFWKDKDSRYLGSNKAFTLDAGVESRLGVVGKLDKDLPWKEQAENFVSDDLAVLSGIKSTDPYEEKQVREDGSVEWLRTRKVPIKNKKNEVVGILGAYQSITEFKQAFEYLEIQKQTSENLLIRLKGLINSSPDMIFYKGYSNLEGRYLICNGLFEDWVGKVELQVAGMKDSDIFDEDLAREFENEDLVVIKTREPLYKERSVKTASGKSLLYEFSKIPVLAVDGKIDGVMCIGKDVTEKRELESIYEAIFTVTNDAYFILSENGAVSNCNDKALEFLCLDHKANMIGLRLIRDFTPEFQPDGRKSVDVSNEVNAQLKQSKDGYFSMSYVHQNIDLKPLYVDVFLARVGNGHTLVQWHDISESKEKQEQLERAKKEAEDLAKTKSLFLANMSHEIRTPLNAIVGLGGLLAQASDPEKSKLYIDSINQSSKHLLSVVNDILDYSKLEAEKMTIELVPLNVSALFEDVLGLYANQLAESNIEFTLSVNNLPNQLLSDPTKLKQILSNLVSNSIKFSSNGVIELGGEIIKNKLNIWVKDSGVGIAQDRINHLFNPFTQEDISTTRKFGGTGLGLSICKGLAELLGGGISVVSDIGVGTTFTVELPFVEMNSSIQTVEKVSAPDLVSNRILIAEDNALNQLVIEELLAETGVNVTLVENGNEAVEILKEKSFDLVLMDIQMPVLDGLSATTIIRKELNLTLPIIALTANTGEVERDRALDCGMDDFLTKPIDQNLLFITLSRWLSK